MKYLFVFSVFLAIAAGRKLETIDSNSEPFECPGSGEFENPDDQSKFYYCILNGPEYLVTSVSCSPGFVFSAKLRQCVLETSNQPRDIPASSTVGDTTALDSEGTAATEPEQETSNETTTSSAPITTTTTVSELGSSETTTQEGQTTTPIPPFKCTRGGMFPDPTENSNYYLCVFTGFGYISILLPCFPGSVFLPDLQTCGRPNATIPTLPMDCKSTGYHPNPKDCHSYYYCEVDDQGYLFVSMICPVGTNYFPDMEACVSEDLFQCKTDDDSEDEEGSGSTAIPEVSTIGTTPLLQK
ncbi:unnamed protein product [Hermetia illucens]|uniref:Chitin-binding type-2 domain-containing protein n=1 Tax=Hermetia illucens TaxID=343691 RepID=A0A7R8YY94_HERIL|nr:unnamed protein product [Hermetia illucens]